MSNRRFVIREIFENFAHEGETPDPAYWISEDELINRLIKIMNLDAWSESQRQKAIDILILWPAELAAREKR